MARRHQRTRQPRFTLDLLNRSALAWTLRKWRDESWPLFVMMNFTCSRTPKCGARSKNAFKRSLARSTGQRLSGAVGDQRDEERVVNKFRRMLPALGYPGGKTEVVGSSGASCPRRSADVGQAQRY